MNKPTSLKISLYISALVAAFVLLAFRPSSAATCPAAPFKTAPMRNADFTNILPLGNFNPPDHTIPTDHVYFMLEQDENGNTEAKNVYAPGTITVTSVSSTTYYQDTTVLARDYSFTFGVCDQLTGRFGHLSSLTETLKAKLKNWDSCQTYESNAVGNKVKTCSKQVAIEMKNGIKIGTVGGRVSHALDLWTFDTRVNLRSKFANPNRYPNTDLFKTTCPIKYFTTTVRNRLTAKLGDLGAPRTKAPLCGTLTPDKAGTLRGNWFYGNAQDNPAGWKKELTLGYDNRDGRTGILSIGGIVASARTVRFSPRQSGTFNRAFETITPSTTKYCYQDQENSNVHFLIRLVDSRTLRIEKQQGPCQTPYTFNNPKTYRR